MKYQWSSLQPTFKGTGIQEFGHWWNAEGMMHSEQLQKLQG